MNKKGFTLIEIIIVIVILGILAALALPRITSQVESANAAEAMQMFGSIKRAAFNCYDMGATMITCHDATELGVTVPATNTKFLYGTTTPGSATGVLWVRAIKSTGTVAGDCTTAVPCILMSINPSTGVTAFTVDPTAAAGNAYSSILTKVGSVSTEAIPVDADFAAY